MSRCPFAIRRPVASCRCRCGGRGNAQDQLGSIAQADGVGFSPHDEEEAVLEALIHQFAPLEDPRCPWRVEHQRIDILVIAICAVLGEAESFEDIALDGRGKRDWLERFLALPNGIPSHDTFRRVLMLVDPERFERGFLDWVRSVFRQEEVAARHRGRSRSTARRCGTRSTAGMAARPCTWSARSRSSTGWCWPSAPPRPRGAS
jgi:DDE_Tnp_1-associated